MHNYWFGQFPIAEGLGIFDNWFGHFLIGGVLIFTAIFIILLVLMQRGKGGGLSGALGGMGGNSALGTKAGDTFTWITYFAATFWCLLSLLAIKLLNQSMADYAIMRARKQTEGISGSPTGDKPGEKDKAGDGKGDGKLDLKTDGKRPEGPPPPAPTPPATTPPAPKPADK